MKRLLLPAALVCAVMLLAAGSALAATPTPFFNGFESDTAGWVNNPVGTITQQPSGYTNSGGYANGIASATGSYHARVTASDDGPYTRWGAYTYTFPTGGYTTSLDVYLDVAWANTHRDARFDWDVASSNTSGLDGAPGLLRDFVFNAGTTPSTYVGTPGFVIGTSTSATRALSDPSATCPLPSAAPNSCRAPVYITASGWYRLVNRFSDGGALGLQVDMSILNGSGATVASWRIYSGDPMSSVGGNRYGWFASNEISDLPVDNSALTLAASPLNPGKTTCNGTYNGTGTDVVVPAGAICTLDGATVSHDVNVKEGGTLIVRATSVAHDVTADKAAAVTICGSGIVHDLKVTNTSGVVVIGGSGCANTIGHDLTAEDNNGAVTVAGNTIGHDLSVQKNTPGGATVVGNSTGHDATCKSNSPQSGSGNSSAGNNGCPI